MYDSFNVLLDLVCWYFVEDFCSFVHQGCVCSVAEFCPTLCDPMDCSSSGSPVHRVSQARMLEWVAVSYSRGPSWPGDQAWVPCGSCTGRRVLTTVPPGEPSPGYWPEFLMGIVVGFGVSVMLSSWDVFGGFSSSSGFGKSLRRVGIKSFWMFWIVYRWEPSDPRLEFVGSFLITLSVSLLVVILLKFSISS